MHNLNKLAYVNVWQFCSDFVFIFLAFAAAYFAASIVTDLYSAIEYLWVLLVYIPIWIFSMSALGMYYRTTFNYVDRVFRNVVLSTLVAGVVIAFIFFYTHNIFFSRALYSFFIIFSILFILSERYLLLYLYKSNLSIKANNAIIIGTQELIDKFEYYLKKTQIPLNIIGYLQINDSTPLNKENCLGKLDDVADILKNSIVDEVIIAIPKEYIYEVEKCVLICEEMGLTVRLVLDLYKVKIAKTFFASMGTMPMITFHTVSLNDAQLLIKRIIDIVGSIIGLIITGIVSVFIIPAIMIDSSGPIFFRQDRVGLNGRVFKLYKFRSMECDAEEHKQELLSQNRVTGGLMFKVSQDPRITRVGQILRKTSMDELPQFWNILKGDMSLVGTRPPTIDEVSRYLNGHRRRISIKPGLTGLWQISGRSSIIDFDEVVRLDTCYIDKWSVMEDFKIIFKTIPVILARKGAM